MNTQTAYQRWEMASLTGESEHDFRTMPPAIARLAQQMMEAKDQAIEQGFNEGYSEGLKQGQQAGEAQALDEVREHQTQLAGQLNQLMAGYVEDMLSAREQIAEDLLKLSLDMAEAIIMHSVHVQPELIIPVLEKALADIPSLTLPASIHLSPDDLNLVETHLGPSLKQDGWRLISDSAIHSGGCTINTQTQSIDLQLSSRIKKLHEQLGQTYLSPFQ